MADKTEDKVVIIATHGPDDMERATLPFVMANAALAMESHAVVILQGGAVLLARTGIHDHVFAGGLPPLGDLVRSFLENGGELLVCTPCVEQRKLTKEMLLDEAQLIAGARVIQEVATATAVLTY